MIDRSKLPNSFEFVVTAGARARQLLAGSTPRVPTADHKKTTIALQEVVTGLNALGVSPRDIIAIMQALKAAGALRAELVIL